MQRALLTLLIGLGSVGCATASGGSVKGDVDLVDETAAGDAIFPVDDASDDAKPDSSKPSDTGATVDTGATSDTGTTADTGTVIDTAPACGAVGQPCCSGTCAGDAYCYAKSCLAKPKLVTSGPDGTYGGADCSNLSKIHLSPEYFQKVVITGRPGAIAYRYYRKTSCGDTVGKLVPGGGVSLDGTGVYVYVIENAAGDSSCTNGNLGVYESWVVVDGIETGHVFNRIYSSGCSTYSTCASVTSACPA